MKLTDNPIELTTAVTDLCLALVATGGLGYLRWIKPTDLWEVNAWSAAFGFIALSGAFGFIAHGMLLSEAIHARVWQVINLSLGFAVSLFVVGVVCDFWGPTIARRLLPVMIGAAVLFFLVTKTYPGVFFIFVVYEALALVFAFGVYVWLAISGQSAGALPMAGGILISLMAAGLQACKRISLKLIWSFDHNGVFHLVQMVGLFLLLAGLRISLG
jgi:Family of unknown function (DUF6962)